MTVACAIVPTILQSTTSHDLDLFFQSTGRNSSLPFPDFVKTYIPKHSTHQTRDRWIYNLSHGDLHFAGSISAIHTT